MDSIRRNLEGDLPRVNMDEGSVCVLIPSVRNSEELAIVLEGLSSQDYTGPLEIVVVGPGNDPGKAVAESLGARFIDDGGVRTRSDRLSSCYYRIDSFALAFVFSWKGVTANINEWG